MAILTPADKPIYFPDIAPDSDTLMGAILRAQALAESAIGANRPLELTSHTEVSYVANYSCILSRFPIHESPPPILAARCGGHKDGFGRVAPVSPFFPLVQSDFFLDAESGRIDLWGTTRAGNITSIRATYYSGFDFSQNTPDCRQIKAAVAAILNYQHCNVFQGLQQVSVEGEYKVAYSTGVDPGIVPESLLIPFRKYRPRSFC